MLEIALLFFAGFFGGMFNSIAGGGSFITFPALLLVGVSPINANATNTFASCSGYLSGTFAFRKELHEQRKELPKFILISLLGGITGASLLLQTPEPLFREAIPWLLFIATLLFIFGEKLNRLLKTHSFKHRYVPSFGTILLLLLLLGITIYGGFFNAGLGIIILSYLALAGHTKINTMNGIKLLISSCVSVVAIALFIYNGAIAWREGIVVLLGTLVGGYIAAHYSRQLPLKHVRGFVIFVSIVITACYFYEVYFG